MASHSNAAGCVRRRQRGVKLLLAFAVDATDTISFWNGPFPSVQAAGSKPHLVCQYGNPRTQRRIRPRPGTCRAGVSRMRITQPMASLPQLRRIAMFTKALLSSDCSCTLLAVAAVTIAADDAQYSSAVSPARAGDHSHQAHRSLPPKNEITEPILV